MRNGLILFSVSFAVSWQATSTLIRALFKKGIVDVPNQRSSHQVPTPRGGGIGIIFGLLAGCVGASFIGIDLFRPELLFATALIASIGFLDDRWGGLPVLVRFVVQLSAAGIVVWRNGGLDRLPVPPPLDVSLGYLSIPVALIWIVGVTNIYNFLDGIDGFAGLQGILVGFGIALLGQGDVPTGLGCALAGSCAGFLLHNWHPAKVFMGDVGSGTVGFLAAVLPFEAAPSYRGTAIFAVAILLWVFLSDGVFTILRRLSQGEKIWVAHCSHLYQRLVRTGMSHDQVVIRLGSWAMTLGAAVLVAFHIGGSAMLWAVLVLAVGSFVAYCQWTRRREQISLSTDGVDRLQGVAHWKEV